MRTTLRAIDPDVRHRRAMLACRRLLATPAWRDARTVFLYLSGEHEIDTTALLDSAWRSGKRVLAPRLGTERSMTPVEIGAWSDCLPGSRGVLEPIEDRPFDLARIDLVLVPGLAFDAVGNRLGKGAGLYDRFLARPELRAHRCGFAFEEQIVDRLAPDAHDVPVHGIVTDVAHRALR